MFEDKWQNIEVSKLKDGITREELWTVVHI